MGKCYKVISILFVFLGIVHIACTPIIYNSYSLDALWFAGTGLSLVVLGLLNISALKSSDKKNLNFCIAANILCAIYLIMLSAMIMEFQAFVSVLLVLSMTAASIYLRLRFN